MKHDFKVTIFLLLLFFSSQIIGLFVLNRSITVKQEYNETTGQSTFVINYTDIFTGRPETEGQESFYYVVFSIVVGTLLVLLIIRYRLLKVWKTWFFLAVALTLAISFDVFTEYYISLIIGFILAYLKVFRPNIFTHNLTEILMYSGIAVLLVPMFNLLWISIMLVVISIYDAIAVWKSKHMITMATFQSKSKMFAGLLIPYEKPQKKVSEPASIKIQMPTSLKESKVKSAILGGGDIAFPLLFAGTVMSTLIKSGLDKEIAFLKVLIIPLAVGMALFGLLYMSKKDRFYPAMPFLSLGCFIGYGLMLLF